MNMAEALKQEDQEREVVIELPHDHPLYSSSNRYIVRDLYDFYHNQAQQYAIEFDQRNQNKNFSVQLEKALS
ncbi:hypothetical protein D3C85_1479870 [compost metagenome]